jgi:hypothetical protein
MMSEVDTEVSFIYLQTLDGLLWDFCTETQKKTINKSYGNLIMSSVIQNLHSNQHISLVTALKTMNCLVHSVNTSNIAVN